MDMMITFYVVRWCFPFERWCFGIHQKAIDSTHTHAYRDCFNCCVYLLELITFIRKYIWTNVQCSDWSQLLCITSYSLSQSIFSLIKKKIALTMAPKLCHRGYNCHQFHATGFTKRTYRVETKVRHQWRVSIIRFIRQHDEFPFIFMCFFSPQFIQCVTVEAHTMIFVCSLTQSWTDLAALCDTSVVFGLCHFLLSLSDAPDLLFSLTCTRACVHCFVKIYQRNFCQWRYFRSILSLINRKKKNMWSEYESITILSRGVMKMMTVHNERKL